MPRRILLVDDEERVRETLRHILEDAGYSVESVGSGAEALAAAAANPPDAFVIDLLMPGMHGLELLRRIRLEPTYIHRPIFVLSGQVFASDRARAIALGAQGFLQKPIRRSTLVGALEEVLGGSTVTFWGTRGSIAVSGPETVRYGGNTPCVSIEYEGRRLILDSGSGIRKLGLALAKEACGKPAEVDLLITHTHWDHIQGFPFFVPAYVPGNQIRIYGPALPRKSLREVLIGQMESEYFPVGLGDMSATISVTQLRDPAFDIGPFHVEAMYMNHPGVTLGYRVTVGGNTVVYATDTEAYRRLLPSIATEAPEDSEAFGRERDQKLVTFTSEADLYIGDSQYLADEYQKKVGWGHSCFCDTVEIAAEAKAKRLALFSHDPMHDDDTVDQKLADAKAFAQELGSDVEVIAAADGMVLRLPPKDSGS